jgi:hypothetical protein
MLRAVAARFNQIYPWQGVDEDRKIPGMIVPMGGSNLVRIEQGSNLRLESSHPMLKIEKLDGKYDWPPKVVGSLVVKPGYIPTAMADPVYFRISSQHALTAKILAMTAKGTEAARLEVAVLRPRIVKVSIRPVLVHGPDGLGLVLASKEPIDAKAMVAQMNSYWTPQANVVFQLVGQPPVILVDDDRYRKLYGLEDLASPLSQAFFINVLEDICRESMDPIADLTMLLVRQVGMKDNSSTPTAGDHGKSSLYYPVSVISDSRGSNPVVMAHEAGHIIGRVDINHGPNFDHTAGESDLMKKGQLMYAKIPYDDVISSFNPSGAK